VVVVVEDAQWADSGLLDFLEHLLEWSAQFPVFVLMATRPELLDRRPGWGSGRRNATLAYLEPLSPGAVATLVDDLVEEMPTELRDRIAERSDGIPLYAVETIRSLVDQGRLERTVEGRYRVLDDRPLELSVPASLTALIAARLDALTPAARALVRNLAVHGMTFTRSAAGALSGGLDEATLEGCCPTWSTAMSCRCAPTRCHRDAASTSSTRRCCRPSPTTRCPSRSAGRCTPLPPST
jgi:predicted ATPase